MDPLRVLAHGDHAPAAQLGGREVEVGELRDGVADALVDRARDLAALRVGERDVHVRGRDGRGDRLEAVGDRDHDVGLQELEDGRQLEQSESRRLGHRRRRLALDEEAHDSAGLEAVLLQHVDRVAEALEHERRSGHALELELGMVAHRRHGRLDAGVVGP